MIQSKIDQWVQKNSSLVSEAIITGEKPLWCTDDLIDEFVDIFSPSEDIESVPFILFSKIVSLYFNLAIVHNMSFQTFYKHSQYAAHFSKLGEYVRNVYIEELIDSIDWDLYKLEFSKQQVLQK